MLLRFDGYIHRVSTAYTLLAGVQVIAVGSTPTPTHPNGLDLFVYFKL